MTFHPAPRRGGTTNWDTSDNFAAWSLPAGDVLKRLGSTVEGLGSDEASQRLARYGPNRARAGGGGQAWRLALRQVESPLVLLLVAAALISWAIHETSDAAIILAIVVASAATGFWQERSAANAVRALLRLVCLRTTALRDAREVSLAVEDLVPGDVIRLTAGSMVPADARVLVANTLFVDEGALTGESFPSEKSSDEVAPGTSIAGRSCALYTGTHVTSGTATAVVVATGAATEFGHVIERLRLESPTPQFELGLQQFGLLLVKATAALLLPIFALAALRDHAPLEALMFALAIAVGIAPELLPAIVTINLARGARGMADRRVIVKRLAAIEDLGSMTVLCSDKTGTLTEGTVQVTGTWAPDGSADAGVLELAAVNAALQASLPSPIDDTIRRLHTMPPGLWTKVAEVPWDFTRKRVSVLADDADGRRRLVTKGALAKVLEVCTTALQDGRPVPLEQGRAAIDACYRRWSGNGQRVIGIAVRDRDGASGAGREDESGMTFAGFVTLADVPKEGVSDAIERLAGLGIALKILTGDNRRVAAAVAARVGMKDARVLAGEEIRALGDAALVARASATDVFAEVEPNQKERILLALRRAGHTVGFLGDGINDAPALHSADVGISVDSAVDVAKEAADVVLLDHDLHVLAEGVLQGRRTFENTLKYIRITTSANFGNMLSMAVAVSFLPFLPLLPVQILLNNFLSDLPAMAIGSDRVDEETIAMPGRWDVAAIRRFMVLFGGVSSIFDFVTFAALLMLVGSAAGEFRSGWFLVSLTTEVAILLVMRTRRSLFASRPSAALLVASAATVAGALVVVQTPLLAAALGFTPLSPLPLAVVLAITVAYVVVSESAKRRFFGPTTR